MATTISGTNGVSQIQDGIVTDGKLDLTANSAEVKEALNASGTAPIYACRAWVNFDGTGTVSIRASGNVSSITDGGTGDYTINFATAMKDADYSVGSMDNNQSRRGGVAIFSMNPSFLQVQALQNSTPTDISLITLSIFR